MKYGAVSTLPYGVQWDRVVQWFIDTGKITLNEANSTVGSTRFGNYSDHIINTSDELNTGAKVWNYTATPGTNIYIDKDSASLKYPKTSGTVWSLSTGALKAAKVNNIYDMAGNMYEWTMEGSSFYGRVPRGGMFERTGMSYPISRRSAGYIPNEMFQYNGFRVALYIK